MLSTRVVNAWNSARSWVVGRYIFMPDHIHLFCAPATLPSKPLNQRVSYRKSAASRSWPRAEEQPIWQRDFWDTQLRRSENYGSKVIQVTRNAGPAGLVNRAEDWPFQGELNLLSW